MCTLSWQIHDDHLNIVFNRDELLSRQKAEPPKVEEIRNTAVLSPKDPEGGGTWISANEYGLVFCLLNYYKFSSAGGQKKISNLFGLKPDYRRQSGVGMKSAFLSRGLLVREASTASSLFELRQILKNSNLFHYQPFLLVVFSGIRPPIQLLWNGRELEEQIAPFPVITTSSLFPTLTEWFRLRNFRKETDRFLKSLSDDRQWQLHRYRHPWLPAFSIAMRRNDKGTVSLTRIRLDADKVYMAYQPGDPAISGEMVYEQQMQRAPKSVDRPTSNRILSKDKAAESSGEQNYPITNGSSGKVFVLENVLSDQKTSGRYTTNPIDLAGILREKNPGLVQKLPEWTLKLLKLIGRESSINELLNNLKHVTSRNFAPTVLNYLGVKGRVRNGVFDLPPPEQRPVFLANHPTGGLDGLLLLSWLLHYYSDIRIVVTDVLWEIPHLRPYVLPVNRYNKSRQSVEMLLKQFESDTPLLVFPAGVTARKINGRMQESKWHNMPVKLARQTNRSIVPVHIEGYNSGMFNGVYRLRRLAGIKQNLEMLLLVREFLNPACRIFYVSAGPVFSTRQILSLGENDTERTATLQQICDELPADFKDVPAISLRTTKSVTK